MLNLKIKRLAYSVERIAYRKNKILLSAKRYPCLAGRQALNAKECIILCALLFGIICNAFALNLDKAKTYFLSGDYTACINECEKILAGATHSKNIDELYYLLGLSYLKDGNLLRASDIFEIILKEFKESRFKDEAKLGLGDTYFLRGEYTEAQRHYKELISNNPGTQLRSLVYHRLSQCAAKSGDTKLAKEYMGKLENDFPLNSEEKIDKNLYSASDLYYTVQVGSFSSSQNAKNLTQKLAQEGYQAYVEDLNLDGKTIYRVRVGKVNSRKEAEELETKLAKEGYPTKIYP